MALVEISDLDDNVYEIMLNRKERANAMNEAMVDGLRSNLRWAIDQGARAIIFSSKTRVFCAGVDLSSARSMPEHEIREHFRNMGRLFNELASAPCITISAVEGAAVGAGADLALACDHRLGDKEASFTFPGFQFGLLLGTGRLANLVGTATAQSILIEEQVVSQEEAYRVGLLTRRAERQQARSDAIRYGVAIGRARVNVMDLVEVTRSGQDNCEFGLERSLAPGISSRILNFIEKRRPQGANSKEFGGFGKSVSPR